MAATETRARGGGGGARRPFAPVAVTPSPAAARNQLLLENQTEPEGESSLARRVRRLGACAGEIAEAAVLGGGKAGKKCCSGSSPVSVSSKNTPAAAVRAPRTASRRRVGSCAKNKKCSTAWAAAGATKAKAAYEAPRAPAWDVAEERDDKVRVKLSSTSSGAGQEKENREDSASRKRTTTRRSVAMAEAMAGLPEPGDGRVKYLVNTFERLLSLAAGNGGPGAWSRGARRRRKEATATTTTTASSPSTPQGAEVIDVSYPSVASSSEVSFPAMAGVACILDPSDRTRISRARGQRRQRAYNSTGSSHGTWSRKVTRVTSQHPFNLRTEQRGKAKEENFAQRLRKRQTEEEMLRNPLAQGLPYTTDEPEYPAKPPTKEPTEPIDLLLHSDMRAVGRAKFDQQVTERNSFMEEVRMERERQQKVDEEIEIKLLRKEQVPRAHPMPDFTRPFVPKRSVKPQTIPREPRFHPRLMRHIPKA